MNETIIPNQQWIFWDVLDEVEKCVLSDHSGWNEKTWAAPVHLELVSNITSIIFESVKPLMKKFMTKALNVSWS